MNHSHQPSAIFYNVEVLRPYRGTSPRVHPTAFIDASAQVIGDVEIGEESGVWMCAVIRGDVHWIRVGRRTNIQDGAVVHGMTGTHPTSIGSNVTVGHGAVLHGCTIEDECLIGMGTIVLNGAHVGSGSIVAAGTLLLVEGQKVPPRSAGGQPVAAADAGGGRRHPSLRGSLRRLPSRLHGRFRK